MSYRRFIGNIILIDRRDFSHRLEGLKRRTETVINLKRRCTNSFGLVTLYWSLVQRVSRHMLRIEL